MSRYSVGLLCLWMAASGCDFFASQDSDEPAYRIAFLSRRIPGSADWQLFLMDADGGRQESVSELTVDYGPLVPSPDRSQIAFVHPSMQFGYELYVVDLSDKTLRRIASGTRSCGQAAWSPAGDRIAFAKNRVDTAEDRSLFVADLATGEITQLTDYGSIVGVSWSPDGSTIAFSLNVEGRSAGIHLIEADGANQREILGHGSVPRWSPDGSKIVFDSFISGASQVYIVNADGSDAMQLTSSVWPNQFPGFWPDQGNHSPTWSPDGDQIAYVSYPDGDPEVYVMNGDGTKHRRLTRAEKHDQDPSWTWNGKKILFSSKRNYLEFNADIFIMNRDGSRQRALSKYAGDDIFPVWVRAE